MGGARRPDLRLVRIGGTMSGPQAGRRYRLAYLVTHPIQYQAPMLRLIASQPDIDLTVFFESDFSLRGYRDSGFGQVVEWDVPLLDGYRHEFLATAGSKSGPCRRLPSILRRSRFDALWVHGYARKANLAAIFWARLRGLKVFVRDEATAVSAPRSRLRRLLKMAFFRLLVPWVDGFLAIGTSNRDYYRANGIGPERIFPMPYAVDNDFFAVRAAEAATRREIFRQSLGLEPGRPIILFASKFQARKRPDDLLHAYDRLLARQTAGARQPYLIYAGDGEMRASVEADARACGLTGVKFLGFRNQTELPALYDLCDVFVLPSIHEPWGLVVNEVMAAGRAVIVGDEVGCAADLIQPGLNGYTVRAGDIDGLAGALQRVLASPAESRRMGEASRRIIDTWSFDQDVAGLRSALRAALP